MTTVVLLFLLDVFYHYKLIYILYFLNNSEYKQSISVVSNRGQCRAINARHTWRVHEVKVYKVINAKFLELEDNSAQVGAKNFRVGIFLHLILVCLFWEAMIICNSTFPHVQNWLEIEEIKYTYITYIPPPSPPPPPQQQLISITYRRS